MHCSGFLNYGFKLLPCSLTAPFHTLLLLLQRENKNKEWGVVVLCVGGYNISIAQGENVYVLCVMFKDVFWMYFDVFDVF